MQAPSSWHVSGQHVRLQQKSFFAQLALNTPYLGLQTSIDSMPPLNVLGVEVDDRQPLKSTVPLDFYPRGDDLVVTYPESSDSVRTQVYWQWAPAISSAGVMGLPGFELQVSVQTQLLDTLPKISVHAFIPASEIIECRGVDPSAYRPVPQGETYRLAPPEERCLQGLVFRIADSDLSYAQLLHPSDVLAQSQIEASQATTQTLVETQSPDAAHQYHCSSRLFNEPLEKGVIRRARVRGIFVPRENDLQVVAECGQRFIEQKPPLTT